QPAARMLRVDEGGAGHARDPHDAPLGRRVVHEDVVARLDRAQVLLGERVGDPIPDGAAVPHQVVPRILRGFGLQEPVIHTGTLSSGAALTPGAGSLTVSHYPERPKGGGAPCNAVRSSLRWS